jgi:hypothetical protein
MRDGLRSDDTIWAPRTPKIEPDSAKRTKKVLEWLLQGAPHHNGSSVRPKTVRDNWPNKSQDYSFIRRWLRGKRCPGDENLWQLGKALSLSGRPWCHSLALLWACGRLAACVKIIATVTSRGLLEERHVDLLWQMLTHADNLFYSVTHDELDDNAYHAFLTSAGPSRSALESASRRLALTRPFGADAHAMDCLRFIDREVSKVFWLAYPEVEPSLDAAAESTFANIAPPRIKLGIDDELVEVSFIIATMRTATLSHRGRLVLTMLSQLLDAYEINFKHKPYSRPIRSTFDDDVYPELLTIESFLAYRNRYLAGEHDTTKS